MERFIARALFACLLVFATKIAFSQVVYGVFGGPQLTTAKYKVNEEKQKTEFKTGFQLGATVKIPFDNQLYFGPAIYYSMKGYKVKLDRPSYPPTELAINNETTIHTLEIAPLLQYDFSAQPSHFFMKFGPAIDIAFSGKEKFDTVDGGKPVERPMPFAFTAYGRFTAQAILHIGYQRANGLMVFAHYAEGLGGLNNADGGPVIKHRIVGLSIGWCFARNKNVIDTRNKE